MENTLNLSGFEELRQALMALPEDLAHEAGAILQANGAEAARHMAAAYPVYTGNLRDHLRVEYAIDRAVARVTIRNTARHAYLVEKGTKPRRWKTGKSTGVMPPQPVMIPIAMARRRIILTALIDLVTRAGLQVPTGAV